MEVFPLLLHRGTERLTPTSLFVSDLSDGSWLLVEAGKGFQGGLGFGQGHGEMGP